MFPLTGKSFNRPAWILFITDTYPNNLKNHPGIERPGWWNPCSSTLVLLKEYPHMKV